MMYPSNSLARIGKSFCKGYPAEIQLGTTVSFMTAPRYFGDGYIMPIVEISVDGEELLSFEEGYENLLEWLAN